MQSLRFAWLIGASPENDSIGALLANPVVRGKASRSGRGESLRGPRRFFEVSKETAYAPRMFVNAQRSSYGSSQLHENPKSASIGRVRKDSFMEGGDELEFVSPP